jgi:exopolyphosphatase/guanosine-5'-triphosphate,3'-diphosphate pyrophosphatase
MVNLVSANWENKPSESVQENQMIAAIDIGTNSLHMVVVKIEATLPSFTIIAREKETVRLGDRNLETGELKPEVMMKAIACLGRFKTLADSLGTNSIVAVATSAVRESPNGKDFLHQVETEVGLSVDLISGPEEARRIYLGVLSGMEFNNKPHIIIDIGGGSTELILGDSEEPRSLTSTKVGAVRLTGELIASDPISETEFKYLQAYARGMLERSVEEVQGKLKIGDSPQLIGTSGTIETIATIHAREKLGLVPSTLNGYQFSLQDLRTWVNRLRKMTNVERAAIAGMPEKRSEVILSGSVILQEAMTLLGVQSVTVCERSLREGVIVDWMLTHGFIDNRLRFQSSIRERSVLKTAKKYQTNLEHSERVTAFAVNIFDQTKGQLHYWNADQRQLLWAAAILHNCGHYISHSAHHKHSYYLIRNGELLGYNETEIEIIANIARYHRKSPPKKKHESYRNLLHKEHRTIVNQLKMLIFPSLIDDECALEMWSLDYKKGVFEEEFGLKFVAILMNTSPSI